MPTEKELREQSRVRIEQMAIQQAQILAVLVGVPGSEEKGLAGDIAEIKEHAIKQNGRIAKNRLAIAGLACFLTGMGILEWQDVIHIFGG